MGSNLLFVAEIVDAHVDLRGGAGLAVITSDAADLKKLATAAVPLVEV